MAPWSWELTSGESPAFTQTGEFCCTIGGTLGSLAIPQLDLWSNPGAPSWLEPTLRERLPVAAQDPLGRQIRNLCGVVRGCEQPVVSGREGLATLRVIVAVKQAAASGEVVSV